MNTNKSNQWMKIFFLISHTLMSVDTFMTGAAVEEQGLF